MISVGWVEDIDLNYAALVIQDEKSGDTIEIQRSLQMSTQDRELGQDTYCLVRSGATHYGGIEGYSIDRSTLSLSLSSSAARTLELPQTLHLEIGTKGAVIANEYIHGILSPDSPIGLG